MALSATFVLFLDIMGYKLFDDIASYLKQGRLVNYWSEFIVDFLISYVVISVFNRV